jgi:diguanylate cyclase (GGDEF)-like protein
MQILTEELRFKLENHRMKYLEHSLSITGSFGLATYPQHAETQADLVLAADSALYSAKSNGRNCVYTADQ